MSRSRDADLGKIILGIFFMVVLVFVMALNEPPQKVGSIDTNFEQVKYKMEWVNGAKEPVAYTESGEKI